MENQAERLGLGAVSCALAQHKCGRGRRTPHSPRIYNSLTESAVEPEPPSNKQTNKDSSMTSNDELLFTHTTRIQGSVDATNDVVERRSLPVAPPHRHRPGHPGC